ncbi:MAG: hypothetical protein M3299_03630, partial [Thermoproteota archaeon]|nr:hypothetical protein [Thermoproteota archaeon]
TEKLDAFERFFDDAKTFDTMLQWLGKVIQEIPKSYGDFFVFCTLTGLRASECVSCIKLVKDPEQFKTYYNESLQALEHFRFPKVFIRRTKAAYISLVSDEFLDIARNAGNHSYNSLKMVMRHNNIDMKMNYCRKKDLCFSLEAIKDRIGDCRPAARPNTQYGICKKLLYTPSKL